jgi:hypothetical protein
VHVLQYRPPPVRLIHLHLALVLERRCEAWVSMLSKGQLMCMQGADVQQMWLSHA